MPYKGWGNFVSYLTIFLLTLLSGCARLLPLPPTTLFSQRETDQLISRLIEQGDKIWSFQGVGRLRVKDGAEESESSLFAVGRRPFKVRLEITHPWGKPLLHIVFNEKNISILSLVNDKSFLDPSGPLSTDKFSLGGLDPDSAWKVLAGRVPILPHARLASLQPNEITLYGGQGEVVEIISFSPRSLLPRSVYFPGKRITIMLSKFKEGDGGSYPLRIKIVKGSEDQIAEIRYKDLQANKPVPEEVFQLNAPPGFEIIRLEYPESQ